MKFQPLFASQAQASKPKAQLANGNIIALQLIRNNFTIGTWLLLGALLQILLFLLPIRTIFKIAPVVVLLSWQIIDNLLMTFGLKRNVYMDGVIVGKHSAIYPGSDGSFGREDGKNGPGGDEITVVLLAARCNHPLGFLASGMQETGKFMEEMQKDLQTNAEEYGWLGGTSWLNAGDRATSSELMYVHYFRTRDGLAKFSHAKAHRDGWDWYNAFVRKNKYLAFNHEVYSAPAGRWENIYLNYTPAGFGTTSHPFKDANGDTKWVSPIVDASRGKLRSSAGRMNLDDGAGNEKYGAEPYEKIDS